MQVSDLMYCSEGYWATYTPTESPETKKSFLIPFGPGEEPLAIPGLCYAGLVKTYMDALSGFRDFLGGPLWKQVIGYHLRRSA